MLRRDLCDEICGRDLCDDSYGCVVAGVTAVPDSVGAFGSLTFLSLPDGVSPLPPSGCTAEMAAIAVFAYHCLSGAERAAALSVTADAAEVEALLDFCSANPGMSWAGTPICGSGTVGGWLVQWGSGDPCAGDGWYGVTCDAAGEHVTGMCVAPPPSAPFCLPVAADPRSCACAETCAIIPTAAGSRA